MAALTNAAIDAKISGDSRPVTRVTDIDSVFPGQTTTDPVKIEFLTDDYNTPLYLTYAELDNTTTFNELYASVVGYDRLVSDLDTALAAIRSDIAGASTPVTWSEFKAIVDALKEKPVFRFVRGYY